VGDHAFACTGARPAQPELRAGGAGDDWKEAKDEPAGGGTMGQAVANEAFLCLTTISSCQHVGDPDDHNPKLAIRNEQSKRSRKSEIIGGGDSPPVSLA
jgi:hypothetical protein